MNVRDTMVSRLLRDLFGPEDPLSEEVLHAYPTDVYLTGILFPQNSKHPQEEMDQLQSEGAADLDSNDVSKDEISLANSKRPSSMGLSFVVQSSAKYPHISFLVSAGIYHLATNRTRAASDSEEIEPPVNKRDWVRAPKQYVVDDLVLDFASRDLGAQETGVEGLNIHIRTSPWNDKLLVTVALVNGNTPGEEYEREIYEEQCFFQTHIRVEPGENTRLCPRPVHGLAVDDDSNAASLIYRDVVDFAVGHTCSSEWPASDGEMPYVETTWLPVSDVKAMNSAGLEEFGALSQPASGPVLSTFWLSENAGAKLIQGLNRLPSIYGEWLISQSGRADVPGHLRDQAGRHISQANAVRDRIIDSIDFIGKHKDVERAFRLANRAILLQRKWAKPDEPDLIWRPFQLGFILLALRSLADETHKDRNTADLLWFPTGGGKTEAYLGLIAFTLFLRRIRYGHKGGGVASIMRYTLRLLTIQQFQRAAALICACEAIRRGEGMPGDLELDLSGTPFSMGLWVGKDATPNNYDEAVKALSDEYSTSRPDQIKYCPKHPKSKLSWLPDRDRKMILALCPEKSCHWNKPNSPLPVWTVDDDVYSTRPSLIIGTVDKFAQIARRPETSALFGLDSEYRQPDLIIQDELHLISGPLGTLAGLYEVAIDKLCTRGSIKPKIIASTATIRQASSQIRALFDRQTCLFPPPVIDASNSCFAVEDSAIPSREFVGITTAGRSAKFTLQAVSASLLQSAATRSDGDNGKDDYWTLVAYFNSLRELGGALVLMQDDVPQSLQEYSSRRTSEAVRSVREPVELTSRVSSSEIKDILETLAIPWTKKGACDILLASNMLSVGVDIPRLGMMVVNGQPKGIAEYIQATSRVGRRLDGPGGLILTIYNNAKSRDRSHYETFQTWHCALYREVEATSVTPFSVRARQKAIHAVLTILVRHLIPGLQRKVKDAGSHRPQIDEFVTYVTNRVKDIDLEEADDSAASLNDFVDKWLNNLSSYKYYWSDRAPNSSLMISAEKAAEIAARRGTYEYRATPTPNSLRNVEASSLFKLNEELKEQP